MPWPIMGSTSLFLMALGAVFVFNGTLRRLGRRSAPASLLLVYMMFRWFGEVIRESEGGKYGGWEDVSFRWGMSWFIFSEVMFFAAFFGALFWARVVSVPGPGDASSSNALLWPGFNAHWPSAGPGFVEKFSPMGAWGLPAINTALLLTSGVTVTFAHWALIGEQPRRAARSGSCSSRSRWARRSSACRPTSTATPTRELNLKLTTGVYGSTFFMLTGFHGFHVTLGAIMLTVIWFRCLKGHFKPDHHFAFEGVAWYWHFVDVVWLGLFIFVYWL